MKKVIYERDNYFIGENGVYLELQNTKEYIDEDGIKRIVIELKDPKKINKILNSEEEKYEAIEVVLNQTNKKGNIEVPNIL